MSEVPQNLLYTKDHEWVRQEDDLWVVGITAYAQESLGDITYIELPEVDSHFDANDTFGVVESVKAASDLYLPVSGTVLEKNESLDAAPETLNQDPYEKGWLIKIKADDAGELDSLLSPEAYKEHIGD